MCKKIFISHSVKDKEIVKAFVDIILQGALSVPITEIFCISTDGTKIKSGEDWRNSIKDNILSAKINFLLISPNYKESEVCMNEMGAAWMTEALVLPLIIDPINYKTVGVIQEPTQIEKLLADDSLDRIRDIVKEKLAIEDEFIKSDRWTTKKIEFLSTVKKHLAKFPFEIPMDKDAYKQLIQDKSDLELTIESLIDEKSGLKSLVEKLKSAKDKTEVKAILKASSNTTRFEEFLELCQSVKKLLDFQAPIINGIIFKSYSDKNINIGLSVDREAIDEALAYDYIDNELDVRWDYTKEMRAIYAALQEVTTLINSDLGEDFQELYDENFDAPMDIHNIKFWKEAFDISISFN
jgi:hypothetical protein